MKKIAIIVSSIILLTVTLSAFAACGETIKYNVTFDYNYSGSAPFVIEIDSNKTIEKPSDPIRTDYRFIGWHTDASCTDEFDFGTKIKKDLTLYASWETTVIYVTFDLNYAGAINADPVKLNAGGTIGAPANPVRTRCNFTGWYRDPNCTLVFDFSTTLDQDMFLYAGWQQYAALIIFDNNYGAGKNYFLEYTIDDIAGGTSTVQRPSSDPVRERYDFVDWYSNQACTRVYNFNTVVMQDVMIYAKWAQSAAVLTYNLNYAATNIKQEVNIGETAMQIEDPERRGYIFAGWYIDAACKNAFNFSTVITEDITLYASWIAEQYKLTVDYNYDNAPASGIELTVPYGSKISSADIAAPKRTGYIFMGWYTDADCTFEFLLGETVIECDTVLFASWVSDSQPETAYRFTYYMNNGTSAVYHTDDVVIGKKAVAPTDPKNGTDYFSGWYTNAACTVKFSFNSVPSASTNLYARWMTQHTYEAEYTNIKDKRGSGLSDNTYDGYSLIAVANHLQNADIVNASNGYYICRLLYNGATLQFDIYSDAAVDDAVLMLRLTPDFVNMTLNWDDWYVEVNGEYIRYETLILGGAIPEGNHIDPKYASYGEINGERFKRPFENYEITNELSLNEGWNTIKLITNNDFVEYGTFTAHTPLIDCMYIYSDRADLSVWNSYEENLDHVIL